MQTVDGFDHAIKAQLFWTGKNVCISYALLMPFSEKCMYFSTFSFGRNLVPNLFQFCDLRKSNQKLNLVEKEIQGLNSILWSPLDRSILSRDRNKDIYKVNQLWRFG